MAVSDDAYSPQLLRDNLSWLFERPPVPLHLFGLRCLTLDTLTLGGLPAKLGGVKNWRTHADEVIVDVEFKLAGGDPNIVLTAHTLAGGAVPLQLAELQFFAVIRLAFSPLTPTFPCFGALTVSFMGQPFFDFSLKIAAGDLMAAPGIDAAVSRLIRDLVQLIVWPQRVVIPLSEEGDAAANRLQPRASGVLLVNLVRARGLPVTDIASGSIYPFIKMRVSGQVEVAETGKKGRTQAPVWDELFALLATDVRLQTLEVDLYDTSAASADGHVGAASLPLGERLAGGAAAWAGWVPLLDRRSGMKHTFTRTLTVDAPAAMLSAVSLGLFDAQTRPGSGGGLGGRSSSGSGPKTCGEVYLEMLYMPYAPLGGAHVELDDVDALRSRVPPSWRLPPPGALVVRLLRCTALQPPPGWGGSHPDSAVRLQLGSRVKMSRPAGGGSMNPVFEQSFEFAGCSLEDTDRLIITVVAATAEGVTQTVSRVTKRVAGEVTGGLAVVGGAIASGVLGAAGGLGGGGGGGAGGGASEPHAQPQPPPPPEPGFMGRASVSLRALAERCEFAMGPVTEQISLDGVKSGEIFLNLEWRETIAAGFPQSEARAAARAANVAASERQSEVPTSGRATPTGSGAAALPPLRPLRTPRSSNNSGRSSPVDPAAASAAASAAQAAVAAAAAAAADPAAASAVRWERAVALMRYGESESDEEGGTGGGSGVNPELKEAVGLIAELTVALHASEQARKALADAHSDERVRRLRAEDYAGGGGGGGGVAAASKAAALRMSKAVLDTGVGIGNFMGSAGQLVEMGVSGVSSGVSTAATSARSGLESLTGAAVTVGTGVSSGAAAAASAASQGVSAVAHHTVAVANATANVFAPRPKAAAPLAEAPETAGEAPATAPP